jgi:hypothetical protein
MSPVSSLPRLESDRESGRPVRREAVQVVRTSLPHVQVGACFDLTIVGFVVETDRPVEPGATARFEFCSWDGFFVTLPARAVHSYCAGRRQRHLSAWEFVSDRDTDPAVDVLVAAVKLGRV